MGYNITESSKAMWERVKADPITHEHPPFPTTGEVEITACCRDTPLRLGWNCESNIIIVEGKPIKVMFDSGWAYKVRREGIYSCYDVGWLIYDILRECTDRYAAMDTMYYSMLAKAAKVCKRAA